MLKTVSVFVFQENLFPIRLIWDFPEKKIFPGDVKIVICFLLITAFSFPSDSLTCWSYIRTKKIKFVSNSYMYYKIIEQFGPQSDDRWQQYLRWRRLALTAFDSVDGILRPDLFTPESESDWKNCATEINRIHLITSLDYAKQLSVRTPNSVLVGVDIEISKEYVPEKNLLGFDIIDEFGDVSLVTNWGSDEVNILDNHIAPNGLLHDLNQALKLQNILRQNFPDDSHAWNCRTWAVYQVDT